MTNTTHTAPAADLEALRAQYREIRAAVCYSSHAGARAFDAAVKAAVGGGADPAAYVAAAKVVRVRCAPCAGTGDYITMVVNGVPRGPGGKCFRCAGAGTQDYADAKRNWVYDIRGRDLY